MQASTSFSFDQQLVSADGAVRQVNVGLRPAPVREFVINGRFLSQDITGVQRVAREVTREIDAMIGNGELDAKVTLLCPPGSRLENLDLRFIEVRTVGSVSGLLWEQFVLPRAVGSASLLCLGNIAPIALLLAKAKVSVVIHDLSYLDYPGAYRRRYRFVHRLILPLLLWRATRLFTVSQTERQRLLRLRPGVANRIIVAPNGGWVAQPIDAACVEGASKGPYPPGYALYVGSLSMRKNFARLLETAIRLAREDGIPFVFVGSAGKVLRQPDLAVPDDVKHMIRFAGQVEQRLQLGQIYRGARILVFPSLYEASPLPPLEAAYFGCPVVASNIPSMWERCDQGVRYCNPHSIDSIVSAVRKTLANTQERERILAANATAADHFDWAEQARTICRNMP